MGFWFWMGKGGCFGGRMRVGMGGMEIMRFSNLAMNESMRYGVI